MSNTDAMPTRSRSRTTLLMIVAIPVLVLLLSTVLYWLADARVIALDTANRGELVQPPLPLASILLSDERGQPFTWGQSDSRWILLQVGGADCDETCRQLLWLGRQTHTALEKLYPQLHRLYLNLDAHSSAALTELLAQEHRKDLSLVHADRAAFTALVEGSKVPHSPGNQLILVDREGWLMMRYEVPAFDTATLSGVSKDMLKDLKRLMN